MHYTLVIYIWSTIICFQLTCYQPHLLSPHLLSEHLLSNSFTINSVAITFICYQASFAIQPQLPSTYLLFATFLLWFSCAITFYSISGKFDKILLKIALNTNNKYILKLIIKKLAVEKIHSYGCICGKL